MKEHIHLFTPVSEGLPEKDGWYQVIEPNYFPKRSVELRFRAFNSTWMDFDGDEFHPTHWLDLSKLTTKLRAEELAESAWIGGHKYHEEGRSGQNYYKFMRENINKL